MATQEFKLIPNGTITEEMLSPFVLGSTKNTVSKMFINILKIKMRQTGIYFDKNAWSDSIDDTNGLDAGRSSNYALVSGALRGSVVTGQDAVGGVARASSTWIGTYAADAFNNNGSDTGWFCDVLGAGQIGEWLEYEFSSPVAVAAINNILANNSPALSSALEYYDSALGQWVSTGGTVAASGYTDLFGYATKLAKRWRIRTTGGSTNTTYRWGLRECYMRIIRQAELVWKVQNTEGALSKVAVTSIKSGQVDFYISLNNGVNYMPIQEDVAVDVSALANTNQIVLKAKPIANGQLLGVAWGGEV